MLKPCFRLGLLNGWKLSRHAAFAVIPMKPKEPNYLRGVHNGKFSLAYNRAMSMHPRDHGSAVRSRPDERDNRPRHLSDLLLAMLGSSAANPLR